VFFQSFVNLAGIILFYPFLDLFGKFLEKRFAADRTERMFASHGIVTGNEFALDGLEKESRVLVYHVLSLASGAFRAGYHAPPEAALGKFDKKPFNEKYEYIKNLHGQLQRAALGLRSGLSKEDNVRVNQLVSAIRNSMYAAKNIRDAILDIEQLQNSSNDVKYDFYQASRSKMISFCNRVGTIAVKPGSSEGFEEIKELYSEIQKGYTQSLEELYKDGLVQRVSQSEISTLINFNREMYTAFKSLVFAVKDYMLNDKQAEQFDELPGFIR
jgi:phosphate:Na+ symporter